MKLHMVGDSAMHLVLNMVNCKGSCDMKIQSLGIYDKVTHIMANLW